MVAITSTQFNSEVFIKALADAPTRTLRGFPTDEELRLALESCKSNRDRCALTFIVNGIHIREYDFAIAFCDHCGYRDFAIRLCNILIDLAAADIHYGFLHPLAYMLLRAPIGLSELQRRSRSCLSRLEAEPCPPDLAETAMAYAQVIDWSHVGYQEELVLGDDLLGIVGVSERVVSDYFWRIANNGSEWPLTRAVNIAGRVDFTGRLVGGFPGNMEGESGEGVTAVS